jgi:hypothetical protein
VRFDVVVEARVHGIDSAASFPALLLDVLGELGALGVDPYPEPLLKRRHPAREREQRSGEHRKGGSQ